MHGQFRRLAVLKNVNAQKRLLEIFKAARNIQVVKRFDCVSWTDNPEVPPRWY